MNYRRFEDLPVWQLAADLAVKIFRWTNDPWFRGKGDLANQLQRAALSISNNIAEGFERSSTKELLQFLYVARGSAGEVRSMLSVIERMLDTEKRQLAADWVQIVSELIPRPVGNDTFDRGNRISECLDLGRERYKSQCEQIARQIRAWANNLQNSDIQGQRHLNDQSRQAYTERQKHSAIPSESQPMNEAAHLQATSTPEVDIPANPMR